MQTITMKLRWPGKSAYVSLSFVLCVLFSPNVFAQSFTDSIKAYVNTMTSRIEKSWQNVADRGELSKAYTAYEQKDYATALKYLRPLAQQGNAQAQYSLGVMCQNGQGVSKDLKQAVSWYRKSAIQGDATAQYNLGYMYNLGSGVGKDEKQAYIWYRKAALQGEPMAENNLGVAYESGLGVARDYTQALKWYKKSAAQGVAFAQRNLGVMYDMGQGVAKNQKLAQSWYRQAADNGDAVAQYNLGVDYDNGQGVPKDYAKACYWYKKAAVQGFANAQYNLALDYYSGQGVQQDKMRAIYWLKKAAAQGNQKAEHAIKIVMRDMGSQRKRTTVKVCTASDIEERVSKSKNPRINKKKLTYTDIEVVFQCNQADIIKIYTKELNKDKHLSGKIVLNFDINASGKISKINIIRNDTNDQKFARKIKALVSKFVFPKKSEGIKNISYPIAFLPT